LGIIDESFNLSHLNKLIYKIGDRYFKIFFFTHKTRKDKLSLGLDPNVTKFVLIVVLVLALFGENVKWQPQHPRFQIRVILF